MQAPPEIIFRSPLKIISLMVMQKSEPRKGDAKLRGLGACPPPKILRNLTLFWRLFVRFELEMARADFFEAQTAHGSEPLAQ